MNLHNKKKASYLILILPLLFLPQTCFALSEKATDKVDSRDMSADKEVIILSKEKAIELALKNNHDILAKKEEIKEASARLTQAHSAIFPSIRGSAYYARYENHPFIPFEDNRGYSFSVDQLLFAGGRVANTIDSARKDLRATKESQKEMENKIVFQTKQAFYGILLAEEFVQIRKKTLGLAEESLVVTEKRFRKGEASHYEVLRSEVEVANIRPQLIKAENFLKTSYNFLKILVGISPAREIKIKGEFDYILEEEINLEEKLARALQIRPALKEMILQEEAAEAQVRVAFSGYLPQVGLNFTNFANQKEAFTVGRGEYDDYWVATVSVSMPIFDGFLTRAKVKEAGVRKERVRILRNKLTDNIKIEVKNTILDLESARRIVEAQKVNIIRAEKAYEIIRHRHIRGEAMQLDLLDARVALSTAQLNYAQSLYDFIVARAKLDYVTGGE
ncbi:hypothetical protein B9J78_00465 [bacterium Unc6]|nr:hypothetical protein [bacterium Unc6]